MSCLLTEAARYETMELPAVHPKKSSTYMGIAIVNLALAYRLSKEKMYLTHAKRFMNTVLSYEKWGNAHLVNVDLSASWILFGLSLGYDWLKPYLSEDERKRIAAKLKHHARIIYEYRKETYGKDWSTNYYQNHNWINMNGLATAGYVLQGEDEYAEHYIEMAKENFSRVYSYLATTDLITRVLSIGVMVVCGFLYMPIFSNSRGELIILKPAAI